MKRAVLAAAGGLLLSCSHSSQLSGLQPCATRAASANAVAARKDLKDIPTLISALNPGYRGVDCRSGVDPTPAVASAVASYGPRALEPLVQALEKPALRGGAATALGDIGDKRAVDPLLLVMRKGLMAGFRIEPEVYAALGKLGDDRAAPFLIQAATRRSEYVDADAARALVMLKGARAPLLDMLNGRTPEDRANAAAILGWSKDESAADALSAHLNDPDKKVRDETRNALARLGRQTTSPNPR
jgi:HEAT repeat protein